ncbi:MAG: transposase [Deltaproteobacteria bacterium]|nr:transposase [Deltaproteobacteria bacterium]
MKTHDKSKEITAIPELLKTLDIKGCLVTTDAIGYEKEIVRQIAPKTKGHFPIGKWPF